MSGWAGFWIGCGLAVIGVGIVTVGDCIETGLRVLAKAYENSCCDCNDEEENEDVR